MREKLSDKKWYPYAAAACIAVALYVALVHMSSIISALRTFLGYFRALFLGAILAYVMNPLAALYQRRVFRGVRKDRLRWLLSITLTVLTLILFIAFMLGTLIPQLVDSVKMLLDNMDGYLVSLQKFAEQLGVADTLKLDQALGSSASVISKVTAYLMENVNSIVRSSAAAGKGVVNAVIALILSVYLLASKNTLKQGALRLLRALLPKKRYDGIVVFFSRCDKILVRYIVFTLLDALIVGVANAIFMACCGMQYIGLVSLVVAVTNLIPTFGPLIGGVIGGFILLLVNPIDALIFVIFTLVLQFLDGYVIKPKLFGNSLGVSGLLILAMVVVCGNMFGIPGILLAIPLAAILDFVYQEELLPALERRHKT